MGKASCYVSMTDNLSPGPQSLQRARSGFTHLWFPPLLQQGEHENPQKSVGQLLCSVTLSRKIKDTVTNKVEDGSQHPRLASDCHAFTNIRRKRKGERAV